MIPAADNPPSEQPLGNTTPPSGASMALAAFVLAVALFFIGFFSIFARRFFDNGRYPIDTSRQGSPLLRYLTGSGINGRRLFSTFSSAPAASGLDSSTIRSLPLLSYTSGGGAAAAGCVVCLSEFEEKERVKVIPTCGHVFHPKCIDEWLVSRGSCPVCRCSEMFGRDGDVRVDVFRDGGGSEEEAAAMGRSWSWCCRNDEEERTVSLRRTCSM